MAEKEYIEREALIKTCEEIIQIRWNETTAPVSWSHAYADFIEDIEEQPVADVIPVVRCKDCKHYEIGKDYESYCNHINGLDKAKDYDFCSYGERKEYGNG